MIIRTRIRITWLAVRRRILPWCMRRGCWAPSVVSSRNGLPRRGNVCAHHFWRSLERLFEDEEPAS
jgi:hypothetical protein